MASGMERYELPKRVFHCIYADLNHHLGDKVAREVMSLLRLWVKEAK